MPVTTDIHQAVACLEAGDAEQAAALLEATLDRLPEYAAAHIVWARAQEELGAWNRALQGWREAVRLAPTSPVAFRGLANAARKVHAPPQETDPFSDIDSLIARLASARIVPSPDAPSLPSRDLDIDIDDVASETLAGIYAAQKQYGEAARMYDALAEQRPEQATAFREQALQMRSREAED